MLIKTLDFVVEQMEINHKPCIGNSCPMTKIASTSPLDDIKQKKDHAYLYVIAMGAGDYYGENNNGDFFYEKDLREYYKTFESAGVFVQHFNKDPGQSIGKVLKAIYNDDMHRVELIIEIPKAKSPEYYEAIKRGDRIKVSMGVKVPQEMCSYCGAITKGSLANRCEHLKFMMHEEMPNGQVVYAINIPPMNFFDISIVRKPADAQGHALFQKVASDNADNNGGNIEDKIATLVKYIDAIDALPPAVNVDDLDSLRKRFTPDMIIRIIHSKGIILKPSEAMFIGAGIRKDDFEDCQRFCDNEGFVRILAAKAEQNPLPCQMSKIAKALDYTNPIIDKLVSRSILVKEAAKNTNRTDSFGNAKIARISKNKTRKAFDKYDFAQYRINFNDGNSVTLSKSGFSFTRDIPDYYISLVDKGYAHSITGVLQNGSEALIYGGATL